MAKGDKDLNPVETIKDDGPPPKKGGMRMRTGVKAGGRSVNYAEQIKKDTAKKKPAAKAKKAPAKKAAAKKPAKKAAPKKR
jgi:hypothetical protein